MSLFQTGDFTLASGAKSNWKIECDAFTADDWEGLAAIAVKRLPPFAAVSGVPRGGIPFAKAMEKYVADRADGEWVNLPLLVCEDVVTTGGSLEKWLNHLRGLHPGQEFVGVCVFARGTPPEWVTPLFTLVPEWSDPDREDDDDSTPI